MSTRIIVAILNLIVLTTLPAGALAQNGDLEAALDHATATADTDAESFFAELPQEVSAFSRMEIAALTSTQGTELFVDNSKRQFAIVIKGISANGGLWDVNSIPVCFILPEAGLGIESGEYASLTRRIREVASEWNGIAGIPDFDFGPGQEVQTCRPGLFSVAVALTNGASNSEVGRFSRKKAQQARASMHLQLSVLRGSNDLFRNLVLHEFGHALGMLHEIQHSEGQCWEQFDQPKLYEFYREEYGQTNEALVRSILYTFDPATMIRDTISTTQLDDTSVMMYSFPKRVYIQPARRPCWAPVNDEISPLDIATLQRSYSRVGGGVMELAGLASKLQVQDRRVIDAYIALMASDGAVQDKLIEAIDRLPGDVSRDALADAVFDTAHSREVQSLMAAKD